MGVSGSGKTTIGKLLAEKTSIVFFDADDFHPMANREKMKAGQPLTDEDRGVWLLRINELARDQSTQGGAIIACSALKEKYRNILASGITLPVYWIFLQGRFERVKERIEARKGHFMPGSLLQSQFDILEPPHDAIIADIENDPGDIVSAILRQIDGE